MDSNKTYTACLDEIQDFWMDIMRSAEQKTADRLKASELLTRSIGKFADRVEHSGNLTINPYAGLSTEELRKLAYPDD